MANLSVLREQLRQDLADIVRLSVERRFENEYLESALFQSLQQHDSAYKWSDIPPEEEQLIGLLAKSKIAWDKALEYALDPKLQVGANFNRSKLDNATILKEIAKDLRQEYMVQRNMINSSQSESGDILVGTLTRTSRLTSARVPTLAAIRPSVPEIESAEYLYDPVLLQGTIHWTWKRIQDIDLAFVKVLVSRNSPVLLTDTVVRTLYDVSTDPLSYPPIPSLTQQAGFISYTLLPTGRWYMAMVGFNWNRNYAISNSFPLDVENYLTVATDSYVLRVS